MIFKVCKWLYVALVLSWLLLPTPTTLAQEHVVFVSEIYYQPSTYSVRDKWVELYNPTAQPVPLDGYALIIGKKQYRLDLTRNYQEASIAPYSTYLIEDSWGEKTHLLRENGHDVQDTSGVLHWLSNVSTEAHLTLRLEYRGQVIQDIRYDSVQINRWYKEYPWTSLECDRTQCAPTKIYYNDTYRISPGQHTLATITTELPAQTEAKRRSTLQVSPTLPIATPEAKSVFKKPGPNLSTPATTLVAVATAEPQKATTPSKSPTSAPVLPPLIEASEPILLEASTAISTQALLKASQPLHSVSIPDLTPSTSLSTTALTSARVPVTLPPVTLVGTQVSSSTVDFRELSTWVLLAVSGYLLEKTLLRPRHTPRTSAQPLLLTIPTATCSL